MAKRHEVQVVQIAPNVRPQEPDKRNVQVQYMSIVWQREQNSWTISTTCCARGGIGIRRHTSPPQSAGSIEPPPTLRETKYNLKSNSGSEALFSKPPKVLAENESQYRHPSCLYLSRCHRTSEYLLFQGGSFPWGNIFQSNRLQIAPLFELKLFLSRTSLRSSLPVN